jgi:transcriptional regulator with XRE-family HTH domain
MDLTERIDLLFQKITKPGGQEYSYREIAERTGDTISVTAIWKLRAGQTHNPKQDTLQALSRAFEVPISFFFDEFVSPRDIPGYRQRYREKKLLNQIALRSQHLDEEGKQTILDMIDYVVRAQQEGGGNGQGEHRDIYARATG